MTTRAGEFLIAALSEDWERASGIMDELEATKESPAAITGFAFSLATKSRFGKTPDPREIIRFVADARSELSGGPELPPREAEALIFATLGIEAPGVEEVVEHLDIDTIVSIEIQLLHRLVSAMDMSADDLAKFVAQAEKSAATWVAEA